MMPWYLNMRVLAAVAVALLLVGTNLWSYNHGKEVERAEVLAEKQAALEGALAELEVRQQEARQAASELQKAERDNRRLKDKLNEQVPSVTDDRVCFANWDAVRVWNQALSGKADVPAASARAIEGTGGAAAVTDADILRNHNENAERWKNCRDQVNAIRKLHKEWYGE